MRFLADIALSGHGRVAEKEPVSGMSLPFVGVFARQTMRRFHHVGPAPAT